MTAVAAGVLALAVGLPLLLWVVQRPQRGVLLLALLLPFDGLLLILPGGEVAAPWKEALVLLVLAATVAAPRTARRPPGTPVPSWVGLVVAWVVLGAGAALLAGGVVGLWAFKIGYFYTLVPLILWRCPLDRWDRDVLVSVLMGTGVVTAGLGLVQQVVGDQRLEALGYDYNTTIRFAGGLLRSFSTFVQPFPFGLYVSLVLLVCLPVALSDPRRTRNAVFLLLTPLLVAGMASSVVRGAILCLLVGLVLLAIWRHRQLVHLAAPAVVVLALVPTGVLGTFLSSSSLGQRTAGWTLITDQVLAAPWGNGLGLTGAAAEKALEVGASPDDVLLLDGSYYQPDNQLVKTVLELGVVGLWLLLLIIVATVVAARRCSRAAREDGRDRDRALADGIAASTIGAAVAFLVATYLEIFPLDFYFWLFLGVLLCLPTTPSTSTRSRSGPAEAGSRPTSESSSVA